MPGPPPKQQRRRRNLPERGEWVELEPRKGPTPKCPVPLDRSQAAQWRELWKSPMASMWQKEDVPGLARVLVLRPLVLQTFDTKLMSELRQLEDRFGLTPKGRRDLRWLIPDTEPVDPRSRRDGEDPEDEVSRRRAEREQRLAAGG
jgi:hypothetical protein